MRKRQMLCIGALATIAMTACKNGDDYSTWGEDNVVTLSSTIGNYATATRASGASWASGDAIGVYMAASGTGVANATKSNIKYTTTGGGTFTASDEVLYYPSDGSAVDFTAYYPYSASVSGTTIPVSVADQSNLATIDLLSASATGASKTSAPTLAFTHRLADVVVNLTAGSGVSSLTGTKVLIKGTNTTATYDLATMALTQTASVADISFNVASTGATAEAIILPREAASGATLVFIQGTDTFTYSIPDTKVFAQGEKTTYDATLTKTASGETAVTMTGATITDWTSTPGGSIDVNFGTTTGEIGDSTGGETGGSTGETATIFLEEFGASVSKTGNYWPSIDAYTGWTNSNLTFTDPLMTGSYSNASIRTTTTLSSPHMWMAAKKDSELLISGINTTGYTSLTLSYDIATNTAGADQNVISVKAGDTDLTVPSSTFSATNTFQTVTISGLPTNITSIAFISLATTNTAGMRIDNVKLVGTK